LINLKKKQTKNQSQQWKTDHGENKIIANNNQQITPHLASEKKPAITRKPIIITKRLKNSIFHFDCGTLFV
jgi:hypothetical protein